MVILDSRCTLTAVSVSAFEDACATSESVGGVPDGLRYFGQSNITVFVAIE